MNYKKGALIFAGSFSFSSTSVNEVGYLCVRERFQEGTDDLRARVAFSDFETIKNEDVSKMFLLIVQSSAQSHARLSHCADPFRSAG